MDRPLIVLVASSTDALILARELPVTTDLQLASADRADAVLQVVLTDARERTAVVGVRTTQDPPPVNPNDRFRYPRVREGVLLLEHAAAGEEKGKEEGER